jgi:WXG100 family type VII secretion target
VTNIDGTSIMVRNELASAGAHINGVAQNIADELNRLMALLAPLQDTWQGSAKDYFAGLFNEWNIAAAGLLGPDGVLGEIAQAMHINWGNYSEAEWANTSTWQQSS